MNAILRRLKAQGYDPADQSLLELDPWLRLVPFVTALAASFSMLLSSAGILAAAAAVTLAGALFPRHILDAVYNAFIRHLEGTPPLPSTPWPRRAAYLVWACLLAAAAACLKSGHPQAGLTIGWATSAMLGWMASQQQCLVCEGLSRLAPRRR